VTDPDVIAIGETMLSLIALDGPLATATRFLATHGGAESNVCVGLARSGIGAAWVSRLGTDAPGDRIVGALERDGIDLRWVRRDGDRPTGLMLRDTVGGVRYYRSSSAASALSPEDLDSVPVEQARAVLVTGVTALIGSGPREAAIRLLDRARGLRVFDPNLRPGLWGSERARELVLPLVERCQLLLAGEMELRTLIGEVRLEDLARRCQELGPREVVIKRGAAGVAALDGNGTWHDHAPSPTPDVDPVGAGDAFNAGYLSARLQEEPVEVALRKGAACGAAVASSIGDVDGFPARLPPSAMVSSSEPKEEPHDP
jgi:2-dehydro-3-deoxygluconokinase